MLPAQESAISESTHFTGGQVRTSCMLLLCRRHCHTPLHRILLSVPVRLMSGSKCWLSGQVLLPSGPVPKLQHFSGGVMHQATPPAKRLPLPRLDIPGAPYASHVPSSTAHVVRTCCHPL